VRRKFHGFLLEELAQCLAVSEIIEDYPTDPRGPSALVLGRAGAGRALHAVCAFDPSGAMSARGIVKGRRSWRAW